jgi:hypothetical protein
MENKQTVGEIASKLQQSGSGSIDAREIQRASEQEYLDNLVWCVNHAKKKINCLTIEGHDFCKERLPFEGSFFVAALVKKEKLLENVLRNYFVPTISCPTPHFDQTVYRYNHEKDDIEYVWTVPDQETCEIFKDNKNIIVPEEQGLLSMVLSYYDGSLFRLCRKLNGETVDTPSIILERLD